MAKRKKADELSGGFTLPKSPSRTVVPDDEADAYVEGRRHPAPRKDLPPPRSSSTPPSTREEIDTVQQTVQRKATSKRRLSRGDRMTIYLPPDLAASLRVYSARVGRSVSDTVTEAVQKLLDSHDAITS